MINFQTKARPGNEKLGAGSWFVYYGPKFKPGPSSSSLSPIQLYVIFTINILQIMTLFSNIRVINLLGLDPVKEKCWEGPPLVGNICSWYLCISISSLLLSLSLSLSSSPHLHLDRMNQRRKIGNVEIVSVCGYVEFTVKTVSLSLLL